MRGTVHAVTAMGAVTLGQRGAELAELGAMARSAARVDCFSDDGRPLREARLLRLALEYARAFDAVIADHAEDASLTDGAQMHEGEVSAMLGLAGWPAAAEEAIIARGGKAAIRPLDSHGTREIAVLSQSFLDLAGKLVDRTDYVRSFAAHVSHELKSPLTAIRGAAELLRDDDAEKPMTTAQRLHFLDNIVADAVRLDALLQRLRELAQAGVDDDLEKTFDYTRVFEICRELVESTNFKLLEAIADAGLTRITEFEKGQAAQT